MSLSPGYQKWREAQAAGFASADEYDAAKRKRERELADKRRRERTVQAVLEARAAERRRAQRAWWLRDWPTNLAILVLLIVVLWVLCSAHLASGAPFAEGERLERFRRLMPLAAYSQDETVLYYTEADQPRAYQFGIGEMGFHDPNYNIAANPDPFGNANKEFPWNAAGGMDNAKDAYGVKFLKLPGKPVVWWNQGGVWRWRFPVGAIVGEVLIQKCPDGKDRPFEVRIRHRDRTEWSVEVYRPFARPEELAEAIIAVRPDWRTQPQLAQAVERLRSPVELHTVSFRDQNARPAVRLEYSRDELPPLPADVVNDLLDRIEFQDVTGDTWRGNDCFAPTSSGYSIVPAGYAAHAIGADNESCAKCHNTTLQEARSFTQNREWYGRVRGADGIFSFSPVRPQAISHNGGHIPASFYSIPGVIERFDPSRHAGYPELER